MSKVIWIKNGSPSKLCQTGTGHIYVGLTIFLELEGKIVDGTANDHLDELETCDDHSHDLGNSHSGGERMVILAHVLSAHRMALRAK